MTAEQLFSKYFDGCYWDDLTPEKMQKYAIEFAKMHVTEALKEAGNKAELSEDSNCYHEAGYCTRTRPCEHSIINAYPLDLIK